MTHDALMTDSIKTSSGIMRARKHGNTFWVPLGSGIEVGDPFEHKGENYIAHEVVETPPFGKPFAIEIVAWRAW